MKSFIITLGLITVAYSVFVASPRRAEAQDMAVPSAADVWQRMIDRYAQLSSYQDEGEVIVQGPDEPKPLYRMPFKTALARPGRFRLDWQKPFPDWRSSHKSAHYVVWSNEQGVFSLTAGPDGYRSERDLPEALVSAGVLYPLDRTVAEFLVDDPKRFYAYAHLTGLSFVGKEPFEGTECYRLRGTHRRGFSFEVWIGQQDGLLHKLAHTDKAGIDEEVHRNIHVNEPVTSSVFELEPSVQQVTW